MKKALITGASGFIGNKTAIFFQKKGYDVLGWNRSESKDQVLIKRVDMMDENSVMSALKSYNPDCIIHCAGAADVGKSVENPFSDFESNVAVTHNLLFALHKLSMKTTRVVFLSSAGVYGNPTALPITEDMPLKPLSPYALHKVMCENICMYFANNYDMDIKIARIFSAYGVGLKKQIFWDMYNKYNNTGRLEMFGTGKESRDYIHVNDVVQALYLLATTEDCNVIYNVANGIEVTIREATEMFAEAIGADKSIVEFNGVVREGDPLNWRADVSKIKGIGYRKTVDMAGGIKTYCEWLRKR